ncbi:hypothetical protein [Methylobacterium sp. CCH5-D2]|uniref:phage protein n=1 Tax=Methylobacterium sp. CCH5-D2 TaxID=1768765 RepID=UPI000830CBBA|nr:hypothetical protein [Methylobacterium sp. CCH5-D2]
MTRLYRRVCRVTASGGSGGTLDLSEFRVRFRIRDPFVQSPRAAVIRISNLSEATVQALPKRSGRVSLELGYEGLYGLIFTGDVRSRNSGRESPTDTYVDLFAEDGLKAYQQATIKGALPANSTGKDLYDLVVKAMKQYGISPGYAPPILAQTKDPRAQVHFGMARDTMRRLAQSLGCTWCIRDGRLNVVPAGGTLPGDAVVLNSDTGMIGRPTQTDNGIIGRSLLNPRIQAHGRVHIDEKSIDRAAFDLSVSGEVRNIEPNLGTIAADGIYKVLAVDHVGDTRGNEFYSEFVCNALGASTTAQARLGRA